MENSARLFKLSEMPYEQLGKGIQRRFIHGESIMLSELRLARGAIVPLHNHHNEQVTHIVEGAVYHPILRSNSPESILFFSRSRSCGNCGKR